LIKKQTKLETALTNIKSDKSAVTKAQQVAEEMSSARDNDMRKAKEELDTLRNEVKSLRNQEEKLQKDLSNEVDKNKAQNASSTDTQKEIEALTTRMKKENDEWTNKLSQAQAKEQQAQKLLKEAQANRTTTTAEPSKTGNLSSYQHDCHAAIATFWNNFEFTAPAIQEQESEPVAAPVVDNEEEEITQATAMKSALQAARAEVDAASQQSAKVKKSTTKTTKKKSTKPSGYTPIKVTKETLAKKDTTEEDKKKKTTKEVDTFPAGLDAETRKKLKTLRRLNPGKSDEELLNKVGKKAAKQGKGKDKKNWFSFKS